MIPFIVIKCFQIRKEFEKAATYSFNNTKGLRYVFEIILTIYLYRPMYTA